MPIMKQLVSLFVSTCLLALLAFTADSRALHEAVSMVAVPGTVHGFVGGEAHESYRVHVREGERLVVRITWRRVRSNRAECTISESQDFGAAAPLSYGTWSADGTRWEGTMPKTGTVFIYVVAHPAAHYRLTISRR
jgi:hypothetical protein